MGWPLIAILFAAACGTGTVGEPVAPPTSPAPAVATEPPTVRAVTQIVSEPSDPHGYGEAETIRVVVDFKERVSVEGSHDLIARGQGVRMSRALTWDAWPGTDTVLFRTSMLRWHLSQGGLMGWPLIALLLAAACETGTDGKPVAPPASRRLPRRRPQSGPD